jgi:hypothetical protein
MPIVVMVERLPLGSHLLSGEHAAKKSSDGKRDRQVSVVPAFLKINKEPREGNGKVGAAHEVTPQMTVHKSRTSHKLSTKPTQI